VLTDFDRTLALLFDDAAMEDVRVDLADFYTACSIPAYALHTANAYVLWINAYDWMIQHGWNDVEIIHQRATNLLSEHEYQAGEKSWLLSGVRSVLEWLEELAIPVAIVSTNATGAVELALKVNGVDRLVSVVLGRDDHRVNMGQLKPSPSLIHEALEKVRGGPALLVGDSINDIVAGQRAGVPTVGVTTGECSSEELTAAGAAVVIPSFGELPSVM